MGKLTVTALGEIPSAEADPTFGVAIKHYLRAFAARRRAMLLLRAAGLAVAVGLAWGLGACLFDRFVRLGVPARWGALVGGGVMVMGSFLWSARRALRAMDC